MSDSLFSSINDKKRKQKTNIPSRKKETRHKHGEYQNVLLTDKEFDKLKEEFPSDYQERIEKMSASPPVIGFLN